MIDDQYLEDLYKFLCYEQFTSAIVGKMNKSDFKELMKIAFWKAENDDEIIAVDDKEEDDLLNNGEK